MRITLDTNIILSALVWGDLPKQVIAVAVAQGYVVITSSAMLEELRLVLSRPKFQPKFQATGKTPESTLAEFVALAEVIVPSEIPPDAVRDLKDRMVLACAVGGKANYIVSGDKDLTTLGVYVDIPILTAVQFLERLSTD